MLCPRCHGKREVVVDYVPGMTRGIAVLLPEAYELIECPYCDGTGIVDCCDGDVAQNEVRDKNYWESECRPDHREVIVTYGENDSVGKEMLRRYLNER